MNTPADFKINGACIDSIEKFASTVALEQCTGRLAPKKNHRVRAALKMIVLEARRGEICAARGEHVQNSGVNERNLSMQNVA